MKIRIADFGGRTVLAVGMLVLTSCSSAPKPEAGATTDNPMAGPRLERGGIVLDAVTVTATVQSVNAADRTVVLQRPDGSATTYECGPDVRNFDQIKVGDQVTVTAAEELALALVKGGVPPVAGTASAIVRSPQGAKPGGKIVDTVAFTAKVVSVNAAGRQVTLQMPDGQNKTVKVGPDINLANVNPGDDVGVRLTRALAISVTEPKAAPAATPQ
ncbi:MAG TPA: hypothetical protein VMB80_01530 [Candidatus Acidoferrum sp.]|nr:hypothetical protein [Candidatus Acidoferrum sp.]